MITLRVLQNPVSAWAPGPRTVNCAPPGTPQPTGRDAEGGKIRPSKPRENGRYSAGGFRRFRKW